MTEDCKDCKLEYPICPVCTMLDTSSKKEMNRCKTHMIVYICGSFKKECDKCNKLGFEFVSGIGTTIFKYKGKDYDPYDEDMMRPLIKNFIQ